MPFRSPKMYSFIFGFQRFVWWPKCTPASSRSFIAIAANGPPYSINHPSSISPQHSLHRLLNWKRLRAPAIPYFFRSFARASRVSSPSVFSALRRSALYSTRARAMPSRTAPACPETPPPPTVARMSNLSAVSVTTSGVLICVRSASVVKNFSNGRWLTVTAPLPGRRNTRAVDVLRRPVPEYCTAATLRDLELGRFLRRVRMIRTGVHFQLAVHRLAQLRLGQHAVHRVFDQLFRSALAHQARTLFAQPAFEAAVLAINLLIF